VLDRPSHCGYLAGRAFPWETAILAVIRIIRHPGYGANYPRRSVLAMGNFDGVHLGHRALIGHAGERARALGSPLAVLTFEPHPRSVLRQESEPFRLTPLRVKVRELRRLRVELLFVQHFDRKFAAKSPAAFIEEILFEWIGARHIVVGYDCTFGNSRRGTAALLRAASAEYGYEVTVLDPVRDARSRLYSSTQIRALLAGGKPREAAEQLGRFWEIDGRVAVGERRGHSVGFPTANLGLDHYLRPAFGVYAVRVSGDGPDDPFGGRTVDGVANLGLRPTWGGERPLLEAHLFDLDRDLYGRHLRVRLVDYLRPEQKFAGLESLRAQIAEDAARAREILAETPRREGCGVR
jgi:riboflavin kinase / FMN adenylyltransferase